MGSGVENERKECEGVHRFYITLILVVEDAVVMDRFTKIIGDVGREMDNVLVAFLLHRLRKKTMKIKS